MKKDLKKKFEKALTPKTSSTIIHQLLRHQKHTRPAPLTSSQQQRMHQIPPLNPGSRGGERLTYLLACSGRSPAGTSTTANKSELPQKFKIPNPKLPNPSTINLVSKKK
jgi:hypothetical protein